MSLSSSIFRRGGPKKELFNDGASVAVEADNQDEEGNLLATLQELDEVLNAPKIGKDFSAAIWRSEYNMAELVRVRKTTAQMNGVSWKGKQYLHIEEAVFFVDRGDLLLFVEVPVVPGAGQQQQQQQQQPAHSRQMQQRLLSLQEAYDLMLTCGVSMERYIVYSNLMRSGYLVMRHPSRWILGRHEELGAMRWGPAWDSSQLPSATGLQPGSGMEAHMEAHMEAAHVPADMEVEQGGSSDEEDEVHGDPQGITAAPTTSQQQQQQQGGRDRHAGRGSARQQQQEEEGQQQQQQQGVRDRHAGRGSARQQQQQEEGQQQQQGPAAAGEAAGSGRAGHQGHEPETGPPEPLHRCWWPAISARHGKLSGVPQSYFDELPRHQAFDSIGKQLRQAHPRLRCFGAIPDGPHLGECSPSGHVVFDVYRPGSRVARGKGQFPEPMYHLAICSGRPPTPQEMRQAESEVAAHHAAGAGQGGCGTTGGGPQPCPLMWASIEDSIITFLRLGTMELLQLV